MCTWGMECVWVYMGDGVCVCVHGGWSVCVYVGDGVCVCVHGGWSVCVYMGDGVCVCVGVWVCACTCALFCPLPIFDLLSDFKLKN